MRREQLLIIYRNDGERAWMSKSACYGLTDLMYSDLDWTAAVRVCNGDEEMGLSVCPVREECLDYALRNREDTGVWGGLSERQRKRIHKRRRRGA